MIPMFRPPPMNVDAALALIRTSIESNYIGEGPLCGKLEQELAAYLRVERVLYMNSCTSALRLAYHLAGARRGTEVICAPMTCLATATAILETGASIVWADIDPETGNISPASVEGMVRPRTVAIAAVDWGGRVCDFDALRAIGRGISLVEDAAHAFGADSAHGRGDFICYSAQAIKHFTTADGGILVCPGAALHERAKQLRWFGLDRSRGASMRCLQNVAESGFKMQGNDILAAIGLTSLEGAADRLKTYKAQAASYFAHLSQIPYVHLAPFDPGSASWFFSIKVSNPTTFTRFMAQHGVEVGQVHTRLDTQACFDDARRPETMPGLEEFFAHQVNLPCGMHVSDFGVTKVIESVSLWSKHPAARW